MNIHFIHGRLARDPEVTKGTEPTKDRVNFTVAVDRRFGDETNFFDCTLFGKRAAVVEKYFSKGSEIVVVGEGQLRTYEDKNGNKRKAYSVVVSDFDFCGSRKKDDTEEAVDSFEDINEDVPF